MDGLGLTASRFRTSAQSLVRNILPDILPYSCGGAPDLCAGPSRREVDGSGDGRLTAAKFSSQISRCSFLLGDVYYKNHGRILTLTNHVNQRSYMFAIVEKRAIVTMKKSDKAGFL